MIKKWLYRLAVPLAKAFLSLRYRVTISGLEVLKGPKVKRGGTLFLANHTSLIDPPLVMLALAPKIKPRPLAVDYIFRIPLVKTLLGLVGAIELPNFETSVNTLKQAQADRAFSHIATALKGHEDFLIFPSGRLKTSAKEILGGASAVHRLLHDAPDTNLILIRISGLWGSSLSRALTGQVPSLPSIAWQGIKAVFFNLVFFTPRRHVHLELCNVSQEFPYAASKLEQNQYLESWYNQPYPQGEPLYLVASSRWTGTLPSVTSQQQEKLNTSSLPPKLLDGVLEEVARITKRNKDSLDVSMDLASDLGLDSLDLAELLVAVEEKYNCPSLAPGQVQTIASLAAIAAGLDTPKNLIATPTAKEERLWETPRHPLCPPKVETTVPEQFLTTSYNLKNHIACADAPSGTEVTYHAMRLGTIALANAIATMPGDRIGILLPATPAAYSTIIATQLAGKIPVMINWTLGRKYLDAITEQTDIQVILTSWKFLDKLDNVDLQSLEKLLVCLEDVKENLSWKVRVTSYLLAKKPAKEVLKSFSATPLQKIAVILFTSGTEAAPKGVPLTHHNLLSNIAAALQAVPLTEKDILCGMLPPFHSFGFTVTGLLPLLVGMRVLFSPNPTDSRSIVTSIRRWHVTLLCTAPTFLSRMLRIATPEDLATLRLVVTGAEKAPEDLFEKVAALNPKATMIEGYGITECSPILTINLPHLPKKGVGRPLPGVRLQIARLDGSSPCDIGEVGVVLAQGPSIFQGYWQRPKEVGFITFQNSLWYNTGDLGYLDEQGALTLEGRLKRFVKIGGEMVNLLALEETLTKAIKEPASQEDGTPKLAVIAQEEAGKKTRLLLATTTDMSLEEANGHLRTAGFSNLARLAAVIKIPALPLLGSGKIDYRSILAIIAEKNIKVDA